MSSRNTEPDRSPEQPAPRPDTAEQAAAEAAAPSPPAAAIPENELLLEQQLAEAQAECEVLRDRSLRLQAELENFRKRIHKEMEEHRKYQGLALVRDLLPGLDNLQRALQAAEKSHSVEELVQGVRLVLRQFEDALKAHGVCPIDAVGQPFDPNHHAALAQAPSSEHPPMTVLEELQRGYRLHDRVVRPSQVVVSIGPAPESQARSEQGQAGN